MAKDDFEERLRKAWVSVLDIELFNYSLLFITMLLVFVLAFALLGILVLFSLVPAAGITIAAYIRDKRRQSFLRVMEEGNRDLKDRLSAAYDNREKTNFIVSDLVRDATGYLSDFRTDEFLNVGRTSEYVVTSIIIIFILISLMLFSPGGFGLPGLFGGGGGSGGSQGTGAGSGGGSGSSGSGESPTTQDTSLGMGGPQDIYGAPSIAKIEGSELELEIHPEYGEQSGFDSDDPAKPTLNDVEPGFVQATAAESYTENIPVELESSIREYFEKLAEE